MLRESKIKYIFHFDYIKKIVAYFPLHNKIDRKISHNVIYNNLQSF